MKRLENLETTSARLGDDVTLVKGFMQVQDWQIGQNRDKIVDLTARSMADNVIIYGMTPDNNDPKEDCNQLVKDFLESKLDMEVTEGDIVVTHRMGAKKTTVKPRPMIVRCEHNFKEKSSRIHPNSKVLKMIWVMHIL